MMPVNITDSTNPDLEAILNYLEERSPAAPERLATKASCR